MKTCGYEHFILYQCLRNKPRNHFYIKTFFRLAGASEEELQNAVSVPPAVSHPPGAKSTGTLQLQ